MVSQLKALYQNFRFAFFEIRLNPGHEDLIEIIKMKNLQIGINWLFFSTFVIQGIYTYHVVNDATNFTSDIETLQFFHSCLLAISLMVFILYSARLRSFERHLPYLLITLYVSIWGLTAYNINMIWGAHASSRQLIFLGAIGLAIGVYARLWLLFVAMVAMFCLYAYFTLINVEVWSIRYSISLIKFPLLVFACVFTLRWWLAFGIHEYSNNVVLTQALEDQLVVDELTQVTNRRGFNQKIDYATSTAKRFSLPLSLLILDIDHFKNFNDSLGHQAGDECLKQVARCLNLLASRQTDTFSRIGGEEFSYILPGCTKDQAVNFSKTIISSLNKLALEHPDSPVSHTVTVSIGVSEYNHEESGDELFSRADKALYAAKNSGRNTWSIG